MKRSLRIQRRLRALRSSALWQIAFANTKSQIRALAIESATHANNHRQCDVGVCALGVIKRTGIFCLWYSANYMPLPGGLRICAEQWPFKAAREADAWLIGIALAGPPQPDDVTGTDIGKLIPCGTSCQPFIQEELAKPLDDAILLPHTRWLLIDTRNGTPDVEMDTAALMNLRNHAHVCNKGMAA